MSANEESEHHGTHGLDTRRGMWRAEMSIQKIERTIIITIGSRAALVAIAVANWDKASWAFQQWSKSGAMQADIMAGAIEGSLVIFTYMLAQRLIANAKKLKSDPVRPTKMLWFFVAFLSFLSAFCNGLYFVHFGTIANPLGNIVASMGAGIVLGLAAPLLAGGIAYLQGEDAETEILVGEAKRQREEKNRKRRETVGKETAKKPARMQKLLPTAKRREKVFALLCDDLAQSPADLGKRFGVTAQTIRNDFGYLAKQGKIVYKDGRVSLRPQKVVTK